MIVQCVAILINLWIHCTYNVHSPCITLVMWYLQESASLADRLIQYQVTRAQEAEETYALKNNLSTTKQKLVDTSRKLEEANTLIGDIKDRVSINGRENYRNYWPDRQNLNRISYTITNNNDIIKYNYIIIKFTFSYIYMLLHCILVAYSLLQILYKLYIEIMS